MRIQFKLISAIFFTLFVERLHGLFEPLAIIQHENELSYAFPHPSQTFRYHLDDKQQLLCFCPIKNGNENDALLPIPQSGRTYCKKSCHKDLIPYVEPNPTSRCANQLNSYYVSIGYKIAFEEAPIRAINIPIISSVISFLNSLLHAAGIMELIDFCLVESKKRNKVNQVLYTVHIMLAPSALTFDAPEVETYSSPVLYRNNYYHHTDPSPCYELENQKKVFQALFGDDYEKYFRGPSTENDNDSIHRYFVQQQLVESDDMVLNTWKKATFYNINTAAMWISVKKASWTKANRYIRILSHVFRIEFVIFSGTYGHLKINDKEITLLDPVGKTEIPVPLLFWKFVYDADTHLGIVIFILNNIDEVPTKDGYCQMAECPIIDTDDRLEHYQPATNGFMYCCALDTDLKKKLNLDTLELQYVGPFVINPETTSEQDDSIDTQIVDFNDNFKDEDKKKI